MVTVCFVGSVVVFTYEAMTIAAVAQDYSGLEVFKVGLPESFG